jgi:hypothetical protein
MKQRFGLRIDGTALDEFARTITPAPGAWGGDTMSNIDIEHTALRRINQIAHNATGDNAAAMSHHDTTDRLIEDAAHQAAHQAEIRTTERLRHLRDVVEAHQARDDARGRLAYLERGIIEAGPGAAEIAHERARQQQEEGYHPINDLHDHKAGDLAAAGVAYLAAALAAYDHERLPTDWAEARNMPHPELWPWAEEHWKPSDDPRRNLEKAGALIAAEIDRLDLDRAQAHLAAEDPMPPTAGDIMEAILDDAYQNRATRRRVRDNPQA